LQAFFEPLKCFAMSETKPNRPTAKKLTREERLAKTLRDNLRRRKQAARKSAATNNKAN
jgi:hypothetical protein